MDSQMEGLKSNSQEIQILRENARQETEKTRQTLVKQDERVSKVESALRKQEQAQKKGVAEMRGVITEVRREQQEATRETQETRNHLMNYQSDVGALAQRVSEVEKERGGPQDFHVVSSGRLGPPLARSSMGRVGGPLEDSASAAGFVASGSQFHAERASQKSVRTPGFDGTGSVEVFLAQFRAVGEVNGWTPRISGIHLMAAISGSARSVLAALPDDQKGDVTAVTEALRLRYGLGEQTELARLRFQGRSQGHRETLNELATELEGLALVAYPQMDVATRGVLSADRFRDAILDERVRLQVALVRATSVPEALKAALSVQSCLASSRQLGVRSSVRTVAEMSPTQESEHSGTTQVAGQFRQILGELRKISERPAPYSAPLQSPPTGPWTRGGPQSAPRTSGPNGQPPWSTESHLDYVPIAPPPPRAHFNPAGNARLLRLSGPGRQQGGQGGRRQ